MQVAVVFIVSMSNVRRLSYEGCRAKGVVRRVFWKKGSWLNRKAGRRMEALQKSRVGPVNTGTDCLHLC